MTAADLATEHPATEHQAEPAASGSRHISIRVPAALYHRLESFAADGNETVSQSARRILSEGLQPPDRTAIDDAISTLLLVRRHLNVDPAGAPGRPVESRSVNILNAKTDLQRLIDDVGRGVEIVITHAGARRAKLVPVDDSHKSVQPNRNS